MPKNRPELTTFERLKGHLRFYKYLKDHTKRELAAYCRVSEQTIYNWLKGKTRPNWVKLRLIEEWLDTRPTSKTGKFKDEENNT